MERDPWGNKIKQPAIEKQDATFESESDIPVPHYAGSDIPEKILVNLRPYRSHKNVTCLACGYSGLMGVKKEIVPWFVSWWFCIAVCVLLIPFTASSLYAITFGVFFAIARFGCMRKLVSCPSCSSEYSVK